MRDIERLMLRPAEFAEAIGVSRSKGYEILAAQEVETVRVGRSIRVPVDSVKAWIASRITAKVE